MRIHYVGNTMTNQTLSSGIALLLNGENQTIPLENLSVRILLELTGLDTIAVKTLQIEPKYQGENVVYALEPQQFIVEQVVANTILLSDPIPLTIPNILTATDFACVLFGENCGTSVTVKASIVVIEENTEYVNGTPPLTSQDISNAVQRKTTF